MKSDDPDFVEQLLDTAQRITVQPGMAASNSGRACLAALSFFACHRRDSHTVQNRFGHALTQSWRTFLGAALVVASVSALLVVNAVVSINLPCRRR